MAEIVRFTGEDGSFMLVELTRPTSAVEKEGDVQLVWKGRGHVPEPMTRLEDSLRSVKGAGVALVAAAEELRTHGEGFNLDAVSLELALSFSVEGAVIVAKGTANAEATVTLTWRANGPL